MAICHLAVRHGNRRTGRRALVHVKHLARAGASVRGRGGDQCVYVEHRNMPPWTQDDPRAFWAAADTYERANGRLYTEIDITLPREHTRRSHRPDARGRRQRSGLEPPGESPGPTRGVGGDGQSGPGAGGPGGPDRSSEPGGAGYRPHPGTKARPGADRPAAPGHRDAAGRGGARTAAGPRGTRAGRAGGGTHPGPEACPRWWGEGLREGAPSSGDAVSLSDPGPLWARPSNIS